MASVTRTPSQRALRASNSGLRSMPSNTYKPDGAEEVHAYRPLVPGTQPTYDTGEVPTFQRPLEFRRTHSNTESLRAAHGIPANTAPVVVGNATTVLPPTGLDYQPQAASSNTRSSATAVREYGVVQPAPPPTYTPASYTPQQAVYANQQQQQQQASSRQSQQQTLGRQSQQMSTYQYNGGFQQNSYRQIDPCAAAVDKAGYGQGDRTAYQGYNYEAAPATTAYDASWVVSAAAGANKRYQASASMARESSYRQAANGSSAAALGSQVAAASSYSQAATTGGTVATHTPITANYNPNSNAAGGGTTYGGGYTTGNAGGQPLYRDGVTTTYTMGDGGHFSAGRSASGTARGAGRSGVTQGSSPPSYRAPGPISAAGYGADYLRYVQPTTNASSHQGAKSAAAVAGVGGATVYQATAAGTATTTTTFPPSPQAATSTYAPVRQPVGVNGVYQAGRAQPTASPNASYQAMPPAGAATVTTGAAVAQQQESSAALYTSSVQAQMLQQQQQQQQFLMQGPVPFYASSAKGASVQVLPPGYAQPPLDPAQPVSTYVGFNVYAGKEFEAVARGEDPPATAGVEFGADGIVEKARSEAYGYRTTVVTDNYDPARREAILAEKAKMRKLRSSSKKNGTVMAAKGGRKTHEPSTPRMGRCCMC